MSQFPDRLIVEQVTDDEWVLHETYRFIHTKKDNTEETITVPVGYTTDFASVPQLFWTLFPKSDGYDGAAVIHDYLYFRMGADVTPARSRAECDDIFLDGMKTLKVAKWKRDTMWLFVRMFGGSHFKKN